VEVGLKPQILENPSWKSWTRWEGWKGEVGFKPPVNKKSPVTGELSTAEVGFMPQLPDPNPLKSRQIPQDTLDSQRILTCFPFAIIFFREKWVSNRR
jgi:hypothetical protein